MFKNVQVKIVVAGLVLIAVYSVAQDLSPPSLKPNVDQPPVPSDTSGATLSQFAPAEPFDSEPQDSAIPNFAPKPTVSQNPTPIKPNVSGAFYSNDSIPANVTPPTPVSDLPTFGPPTSNSQSGYASSTLQSAAGPETVTIRFLSKRPTKTQVRLPNGKTTEVVREVFHAQSVTINLADDLESHDLPPEGKRAAVLAVTAARHQGLLEKLKAAKTPEEKETAAAALKENYAEHYAVETWWREQKLSELELRLQELRAQVDQRQESEEKYVAAAMTIAELWADGIGITPPTPSHQPVGAPQTEWLPGPTTSAKRSGTTYYGASPQTVPTLPQIEGVGSIFSGSE